MRSLRSATSKAAGFQSAFQEHRPSALLHGERLGHHLLQKRGILALGLCVGSIRLVAIVNGRRLVDQGAMRVQSRSQSLTVSAFSGRTRWPRSREQCEPGPRADGLRRRRQRIEESRPMRVYLLHPSTVVSHRAFTKGATYSSLDAGRAAARSCTPQVVSAETTGGAEVAGMGSSVPEPGSSWPGPRR